MSKKIAYVQGHLQVILGILDEDNNVISKVPVELEIAKLDAESYQKAFESVVQRRDILLTEVSQAPVKE